MKKITMVGLLLLFFSIQGYAQGYFNLMNNPYDPAAAASGWSGVTGNTDEPLSFYYNPAKLGVSSEKQTLKGFTTFSPVKWSVPSTTCQLKGLQFQQDLSAITDLPLTAGIGYMRGKYYMSEDYTGYSYLQKFYAFSFGAALDYKVKFGLGLSIKKANLDNELVYNYDHVMYDFGFYAEAPLHELLFPRFTIGGKELGYLRPLASVSLGYSMMNYGDKTDIDVILDGVLAKIKEPLARTARLGYTVDLGLCFDVADKPFNLLTYSFSVEAEDNLAGFGIERYNGYIGYRYTTEDYEKGLGHFRPVKNFINLEGDTQVTLHKSHRISLLETFTYMYGSQNNTYRMIYLSPSSGYIFSSDGLFKLLSDKTNNEHVSWILNHFAISYYVINFMNDSDFSRLYGSGVSADGVSISLKNFIKFE